MKSYHERKLSRRFEYVRANPKIFARTMQEGEKEKEDEEMIESETDEEVTGESADSENSSSSTDTLPASSGSDDSGRYRYEGWSTDEDDY